MLCAYPGRWCSRTPTCPSSHPWLEREIAGAGHELRQVSGVFTYSSTPYLCGCVKTPSAMLRSNPRA
eukprot:1665199-Prymnesium_polylepis.2